ncbi:gibberellin-regulated protein 6-like isoform X1 [Lycium ferocissimum]|uniref:gibberellin-regulated protein 6-like isoform X1 n=1 Tax=Lycium ferocissimum TaxID=112874 RepID=UPI002815E8B3|nr:gibberellin-regulated protein 6-like isoform X1 [Lycium ferocissimum]
MERITQVIQQEVIFFLCIFLICFAMITESAQLYDDSEGSPAPIETKHHKHKHAGFTGAECPDACTVRCSKTAYKKPCMFFCQKCCFKCKCVPPGTYGHKSVCPCYDNWKTKRGGPKCP